MTEVPDDMLPAAEAPIAKPNTGGALRAFRRNVGAVIGLAILAVVFATAILGPWFFPDDPWNMATRPFLRPFVEGEHLLGSDLLGRDVLTGIVLRRPRVAPDRRDLDPRRHHPRRGAWAHLPDTSAAASTMR